MINSIATLSDILENKEVGLLDRLYSELPEGRLSEKIYKLRKVNGLGLEGFAERVGVSVSAVQSWEKEGKPPNLTSLKKICAAFNLDISYFEFED